MYSIYVTNGVEARRYKTMIKKLLKNGYKTVYLGQDNDGWHSVKLERKLFHPAFWLLYIYAALFRATNELKNKQFDVRCEAK